ncbi:MAG: MerR family DNA-binding protein, partial [Phycisphaeraceae bacterium]|nr:MerR family DNA-binding protein [Phycisphaeraceae bacterium]
RSPAGYRIYGDAALERLRFIRAAQNSGFRLDDIAALLELREGRDIPREEVRAMLTDRLADVRRRLSELRVLERALKRSLDACTQGGEGESCPVVHEISLTASGRNKKAR